MKTLLLIMAALPAMASAQESALNPIRLEAIGASSAQGEVRIHVTTSAAARSSGSVAIDGGNIVWDLPGVICDPAKKQYAVNENGVQNVAVFLRQKNPPVTRITIKMKRPKGYALAVDGAQITLRIDTENAAATGNKSRQQGAIPAARGGALKAVSGIFRRPSKETAYIPGENKSTSADQTGNTAAPLPPIDLSRLGPEPERETAAASGTGGNAPRSASSLPSGGAAPPKALTAENVANPSNEPRTANPEAAAPLTTAPSAAAQPATAPATPNRDLRTVFHVKFVQQDAAYIDAGRNAGLSEGMKLVVVNSDAPEAAPNAASPAAVVAELTVVGIAETSAVTEVRVIQRGVSPGDLAYLSDAALQGLVQQQTVSATRKYPAVISFSEDDDALDEEARAIDVPRPPLPSVNRMSGRIGFDYFGTRSLDSTAASGTDLGLVLRANFTRIGGTYWNFIGYWRGTIESTSAALEPTLQETLNRTYQIGLTYDSPNRPWVAGVGRLYLPWASSLNTIDGGYLGRRIHEGVTVGIFAGSTPDPTSWNYNPNQQTGGSFVNFTGGSFDALHYSSTAGAGVNFLDWAVNRPFIFLENTLSYRRSFSVYSAVQADSPAGTPAVSAPGPGIGSSFFTVRWSPIQRLELDFNDTYFRDIPTFDPTLVGTGLLDKYLFQGASAGARVQIFKELAVYTELGRSSRTGDTSTALNEMYGVTFGRIPRLDLRADVHYSRFNSSFGSGSYEALSLSRNISERFQVQILAGDQSFVSTLAGNQSAIFATANVENDIGAYFFTQGGFTVYRGQQQNYNQWMVMLGYRFDSKWRRK